LHPRRRSGLTLAAAFEPLGLNPTLAEPAAGSLSTDSLLDARFRVGALVGQGGMSRVYHAVDERSGEAVAVKLLHEGDRSGTHAARFAREAELLAQLTHPAIVRHVAHGRTASGPAYLAMEWLVGEDLAVRLQRGPLAVDEVVRLLRRAAEGLTAAHARGILHPRPQAVEPVSRRRQRRRAQAPRLRHRPQDRRARHPSPAPAPCSGRRSTCRPSRSVPTAR
jgi:hypothetical protein